MGEGVIGWGRRVVGWGRGVVVCSQPLKTPGEESPQERKRC